jgi:hypothetical protein
MPVPGHQRHRRLDGARTTLWESRERSLAVPAGGQFVYWLGDGAPETLLQTLDQVGIEVRRTPLPGSHPEQHGRAPPGVTDRCRSTSTPGRSVVLCSPWDRGAGPRGSSSKTTGACTVQDGWPLLALQF